MGSKNEEKPEQGPNALALEAEAFEFLSAVMGLWREWRGEEGFPGRSG